MDEETNNQPQNQNNSGFVTKPVEAPILGSISKAQLKPEAAPVLFMDGIKDFYKVNKFYFWAIFAGVIIIAVLSYFAFKKAPAAAPKNANVAINIQAPSTVPSGSEEVYQITLQNNDSQKLVNLELELTYPDGQTFDSSAPNAPENLSGTLFTVPDLSPGQSDVVFVKAKVTGNVNDQQTLDAKLHYHFSSFNSEYIQDQTFTARLSASNVVISLQGPSTTNNAQLVLYTVNYQNNSGQDISNGRVTMDYPAGFTFSSATPPPDLGSDTWNISSLANNASSTIQIQGNFTSVNPGDTKTATAEFLILGQGGQYFIQNSSSFNTSISSLPLLVTQALTPNNSTGVINPGDSLNFTVTYQNNAATAATGVNIEVDLNSKVIDPSSITAQGAQINNNTIIWNASDVPQLASLSPNQSGQLSFSLKINNPATKDSSKDLTLVSNIKMGSNEYASPFPGGQLSLNVSSPSAISKSLTYLSGPLPPKVNNTTKYAVSLALTNSSNDFSNGILTAFVPANGLVAGSFSAAEAANVQYDPSTGKITWNFGSLPANTGRFTAPRTLSFQVNLSASASQVDQAATLVNQIGFTAMDIFTGQNVSATVRDVTTQDLPGNNGYSYGQVTN